MQTGKLHKIVIAVSVCLLIQLCISWKLWIPYNREFPLISAFSDLNVHYGVAIDATLFVALCGLIIALLFYPLGKWLISGIVIIFFLFILEDITRFQPWLYMFGLILVSIALLRQKKDEEHILFVIRVILSATYIWSGIQKINHSFTVDIFPWLMSPFGLRDFFIQHHRLVYIIPLVEILSGIGLLTRKFQKPAGIVLIVMHLILLYVLGPFGSSWNKLIWPWNAALLFILIILITRKYQGSLLYFNSLKKSTWFYVVLLLVFVMPALSFIGCWDYYLAGNLYSGNSPEIIFYSDKNDTALHSFLAQSPPSYYWDKNGEYFIVDTWALNELNAPLYPADRYFKRIGSFLCSKVANKQKAGMVIIRKSKITSQQKMEDCKCDSLLKSQ